MCQALSSARLDGRLVAAPRSALQERADKTWRASRLRVVMDDPTRKARFAYALRRVRENRGLSAPELARLMNVERATVNSWEKPHKTAAPSILVLGTLCDALGVDANLFAVLPPIPAWEGETYLMDEAAERAIRAALESETPQEPDDGDDPPDQDPPARAHGRPRTHRPGQ